MKDGPGGDRELLFAGFAFPDRAAFQVVMLQAAALRANRLAFGLRPADRAESLLSGLVRHAQDFRQ